MKIETLKDLKKLLLLCREQGVNVIKVDGMELILEGTPAVKTPIKAKAAPTYAPGGITEATVINTPDALTEEQLLFYSAGEQQ